MTVGHKQELFATLLPKLTAKAHELGYHVRLRELQRPQLMADWYATHCARKVTVDGEPVRCEKLVLHEWHQTEGPDGAPPHEFRRIGSPKSLHIDSLAIDLYLRSKETGGMLWAAEHDQPLGEYWESLHELARWGGRFNDAGHFSIGPRRTSERIEETEQPENPCGFEAQASGCLVSAVSPCAALALRASSACLPGTARRRRR